MDYRTFVDGYRMGTVKAHIDRSKAGFMYGDPYLLPLRIRKRQATQRFIAFAGILVGFGSLFWLPWWAGLGIVVFFAASLREVQKAAAEGVLEALMEDGRIYEVALARGVLRVEPVNQPTAQ